MHRAVCVTAALLAGASGAPAADVPLAAYEAHVNQYLDGLWGLSVRVVDTDAARDGSVRIRAETTIDTIRDHMRAKQVRTATYRDGTETTTVVHGLLRPDGYFHVREKSPNEFVLESNHPRATTLLKVASDSPIQPLATPVCRLLRPLLPILKGDVAGFRLQTTDFTRRPDGITFLSRDTINGNATETRYELNAAWLATRTRVQAGAGDRVLEQTVEYTTFQGATVPARVTSQYRNTKSAESSVGEMVYQNYAPFSGTPADFSLSRFGIPERVGYQPQGGSARAWLYLIAAAVVMIGLCVAFARRAARRRTASAGAA